MHLLHSSGLIENNLFTYIAIYLQEIGMYNHVLLRKNEAAIICKIIALKIYMQYF